ncbi:hypothetical protein [Aquisphaera insulae]|uniref:hypothetical protein n=1 Tax=Aquisphaera insulae TaxID=2712864 RepID=UPI0013EA5BE2|nr:hypothetical protein [Aquisphaera insulae]
MNTALRWVAVLAGLAGGPVNRTDGPEITYQFKTIEVRGLEWREGGVPGLKAVASRGGVTVWTAPKDFIQKLPAGSVKEGPATPKVMTRSQTPAHVTSRKGHSYVTQVAWRGEGTAPRQTSDTIREGMAATVSGRAMDQGILTQVVIEDTEVRAVHTVSCPSPEKAKVSKQDAKVAACTEVQTDEACCHQDACPEVAQCAFEEAGLGSDHRAHAAEMVMAGAELGLYLLYESYNELTDPGSAKWAAVEFVGVDGTTPGKESAPARTARVEIPEVGRAEIAGEWLIPKDEVLLVAFGPHTVADKDGKAVVREHLAMITAEEVAKDEEKDAEPLGFPVFPPAARTSRPASVVAPAPAPAPANPALPMPAMPSRTLPQGVNADGTPAALPKLPEEDTTPAPEGSAQPTASPQGRKAKAPK